MSADLDALITDGAALLRENLDRLKKQMNAGDKLFDPGHSKNAQALARSIAALGAEGRKANSGIEDAARKTTRDERIAHAERWLSALPREMLRPIVGRLAEQLKGK